jgi:hypothetical protein
MVIVPIGIIVWLAFVVLTMLYAKERYRSPVLWGFFALFLGFLPLIPLWLLGDSKRGLRKVEALQEQDRERELRRLQEDEEARLRARSSVETSS